jgi:hypothetical protein
MWAEGGGVGGVLVWAVAGHVWRHVRHVVRVGVGVVAWAVVLPWQGVVVRPTLHAAIQGHTNITSELAEVKAS